jgi:RNA polymerase sigma-70 factor (ECF subfamily)
MAHEADVSALYWRHGEALLLFFVRRTTDVQLALDLWAETFAQAVVGRGRYRGRSDQEAAGWLYGIARRQLAMYYRHGRAERRALDRLRIERPPCDDPVEAEIARRAGLAELRRELAVALATLSDDTRRALELRVVDELPYAEVARRLKVSEPTARARVSRGLRALGEILDPITISEATRA